MAEPSVARNFSQGSIILAPCKSPVTCSQNTLCQPTATTIAQLLIRDRREIAELNELLRAIRALQAYGLDVAVIGPRDLIERLEPTFPQP